MDRRDFLAGSTSAALATAWNPAHGRTQGMAAGADPAHGDSEQNAAFRKAVGHYRFGVNYTPSHNWWFCWNDWNPDPIRRDLDAIAALGADHLRIMLIWPYFQPNLTWVSPAHLERLNELLEFMAERRLDALITVFTGQLSGWYFLPPFNKPGAALYTDPKVWNAQQLLIDELARVMKEHRNIIGFDFGNEMNTCWSAETSVGDAWMARMFQRMNSAYPGGIHVNGVDHLPWFKPTTFSARALAANPFPVIHAYPWWSGALKYGGSMDPPSAKILAAFAALVRSYAGDSVKPIWAGEFNTCIEAMDEKQQAVWLETAITAGIEGGVSWFTYWDSHDVDRKFAFNPVEYRLGLLTNDGRVKEQGRVFKQMAGAIGGKRVLLPAAAPPPPPEEQTIDGTWKWLLDVVGWKPKSA
jgi:endo-1,4-beta-mannosidase